VVQVNDATGDVKVLYDSQRKYEQITGRLHMLREWKVGAHRGSCIISTCLSLSVGSVSIRTAAPRDWAKEADLSL